MEAATTITIQTSTRATLEQLGLGSETYDETISRLAAEAKQKRLYQELVEAYTQKAEEDLVLNEEWELTSVDVD